MKNQRLAVVGLGLCLSAAAFVAEPTRAEACGGCFAPTESNQVVTDHRMVMAVHPTYSILWDQIRYSGNPQEFAWVLPVSGDVTIDVANGDFFTQLDNATTVRVQAPFVNRSCPGSRTFAPSAAAGNAEDSAADAGVQVLHEAVVGPYETVTLRSTDTGALTAWLRAHAYTVPASIEPTIQYYNDHHMDFVALRLLPGAGVDRMQPVRIRFATPNMVLPLRMVAAGVADKVGIDLWVFAAGRYETANFANGLINPDDVIWDWSTNTSNYAALFDQRIRDLGGRAWITQYAQQSNALSYLRYQTGGPTDPSMDGGTPAPTVADEWDLATNHNAEGVWITRLRTDLLPQYLDADLQLQPSALTTAVSNQINVVSGHERGNRPVPNCPPGGGLFGGFPSGGGSTGGAAGGGIHCTVGSTPGATHGGVPAALALAAGALGLALARRRRK